MINFDDVGKKYQQSSGLIDECMEVVNRDNPFDTSSYAHWIHIPTLARWLYGSSQESLRGYRSTAYNFLDSQLLDSQDSTCKHFIEDWNYDLSEKVLSFRNRLLMVFGTSDEKLAEVLSK